MISTRTEHGLLRGFGIQDLACHFEPWHSFPARPSCAIYTRSRSPSSLRLSNVMCIVRFLSEQGHEERHGTGLENCQPAPCPEKARLPLPRTGICQVWARGQLELPPLLPARAAAARSDWPAESEPNGPCISSANALTAYRPTAAPVIVTHAVRRKLALFPSVKLRYCGMTNVGGRVPRRSSSPSRNASSVSEAIFSPQEAKPSKAKQSEIRQPLTSRRGKLLRGVVTSTTSVAVLQRRSAVSCNLAWDAEGACVGGDRMTRSSRRRSSRSR